MALTFFTTPRVVAFIATSAGVLSGYAMAQDLNPGNARAELPEEEVLELIDDEETSAHVAETLSWLRENPIDLNSAQRDELLTIPGITGENADAILSLREREEHLTSIEEICSLPGGKEILARIRPYVFVRRANPGLRSSRVPRVELSSRLSGFVSGTESSSPGDTFGSSPKWLSRLSLAFPDHVTAGLLFEKDAWEKVHDGFSSGYISYHSNGVIEHAVLGDFSADLGQGLVLWRATGDVRNGDVVGGIRRPGSRLLPSHGADETHYLRGGAIALKSRVWALPVRYMLCVSRTSLAAVVNEQGEVSSLYTTGLYRTASELKKKNSVSEFLVGSRLEFGTPGKATMGLTYYRSSFDRFVDLASSYGFSGERSDALGADFCLSLSKLSLFGELARAGTGGTAWIAGAVIGTDSALKASITCRDYSEQFRNPHAQGYGIQTNTSNEYGITLGWSIQLFPGLTFRGYADQCKIPSSTYSSLLPRTASDLLVEIAGLPTTKMHLSFAFRTRRKESMQADVQGDEDRNSARVAGRLEISQHLALKIRAEHMLFGYAALHRVGKGDMVSQAFCSKDGGLEWEGGAAFFDTEAPLYDYEGNLRGCIASPVMNGRGSRWHLLLAWSSLPWVRLAGKYAVMINERRPVARELGVQVEIRF